MVNLCVNKIYTSIWQLYAKYSTGTSVGCRLAQKDKRKLTEANKIKIILKKVLHIVIFNILYIFACKPQIYSVVSRCNRSMLLVELYKVDVKLHIWVPM